MDPEKVKIIEGFWVKLEARTETILFAHEAEVHAVARALLERNDLTGKECIEIIRSAADQAKPVDSELLLKTLVDETIVNGKNGKNGRKGKVGKKAKSKSKETPKTRAKVKAK